MLSNELFEKLSKENKKTELEIALKLAEETGEVSEAVLGMLGSDGMSYKENIGQVAKVKEECVDVIMVALSLVYKLGGTKEEINTLLQEKTAKWERVTK